MVFFVFFSFSLALSQILHRNYNNLISMVHHNYFIDDFFSNEKYKNIMLYLPIIYEVAFNIDLCLYKHYDQSDR